jgi:WD40 repeat protein
MLSRAVASIAAAAPRRGRGRFASSPPRYAYTAFISYSHGVDGALAPAVQLGLHRFARPWYRLRALRAFRDQASLSASPALWSSIVEALDGSEFFVLLASPEAAQSRWVDREVAHWCDRHLRSNLLVVLTAGELVWDEEVGDFDWTLTTAMPPSARGKLDEEPRWIDLRWARASDDLSLRNGRFRDAIADLAAPLHGRAKDELVGEDVRQHRRTMVVAATAATALAFLAVLASAAALIAWHERGSAIEHARVARSRELAARAVAQLAVRTPELNRGPAASLTLALAAINAAPSPTQEATNVLRRALAVPHVRLVIQERSKDVALAFTADGGQLVTVAADGRVAFWNTSTGRKTRTETGARALGTSVALSPDGRRFVTAAAHNSSRLWDMASGRIVSVLPGSASSSPFGRGGRIVVTTRRGATWLFDAGTGKPLGRIGAGFDASLALFNPAGTRLALVGSDGRASEAVTLWDVKSRRLRVLYRDESNPELTFAAFSPNGRRLGVAGYANAAVLATDGSSSHPLNGHVDEIRSIAFSPDARRVLTVSADRTAIVWDATTGQITSVLPLTGYGNSGAFSPDGRWIATAADDASVAQLWDATTGSAAAVLGGMRRFASDVVFSPDGKLLASRDDTGRILVWELVPSGKQIGSAARTGGRIPDRAGAATVTVLPKTQSSLSTTLVWRTRGGTIRRQLTAPVYDAQSPNRAFLAYLPQDGQDLTIWLLDKKTHHTAELRHDGQVEYVAWSPNSALLATASDDAAARVWTAAGGQVSIERGHRGSVTSVAFDPNSEILATAGQDGTVRIWDVASGEQLAVLGGGPGAKPLEAAQFSPDGRLVAARAVDGSVVLYACSVCGSLNELTEIGRSRTHMVRPQAQQ